MGIILMNNILTETEHAFLARHGLTSSDVFDGRHVTSGKERGRLAKAEGRRVVLRDPSRAKCGHRLTTRSGHCVECDPAKLAYSKRHSAAGLVYVAGSRALGCVKIGVTSDIEGRVRNLTSQSYAGVKDWEMLFYAEFKLAGAVEVAAQGKLAHHKVTRTTSKDGKQQETKEIFQCSFQDAYQAVAEAAQAQGVKPTGKAWRARSANAF